MSEIDMSEIDQQINYLITHDYHIPVFSSIDASANDRGIEKISVKEVLYSLLYRVKAIEKENTEIKKDFIEFIEISSQFTFMGNERRQEIMNYYEEKYKVNFPFFYRSSK